jgi:hypothetical protein
LVVVPPSIYAKEMSAEAQNGWGLPAGAQAFPPGISARPLFSLMKIRTGRNAGAT